MDLFEAISARRSYRGMYKPDPVPREHLRMIMQAALDAPSGCNKQTTSVIAVDDPALVKHLGTMLERDDFASAPAAICILTERKIAYRDRTFYIQDYSAAIQNALLAITGLGYESCWVEGHITDADQIGRQMADVLGVPEHIELVAYLPVGLAAEEGNRVRKLPFEERAWFNGYRL
ncbi:MAG: nitroreductase family protein [Clostridia bacterium]|nr:nitroreductase family protein [Clostridia bacterium]